MFGPVVVLCKIDGFFFEVCQQRVRQLGHSNFGVAHRRGGVAIYRAKIALSIYQWVAQRKRLRHTNDGVVDRGVTMWVIFTDNVTHDTRRLLIGFVPVVIELVHGKEHAPVHGL